MKKILLLTLSLLLILAMCVSCNKKDGETKPSDDTNTPSGDNTDTPPSGNLVWSENTSTLILVSDSDNYGILEVLSTHVYETSGKIPQVKGADVEGDYGRIIVGDNGSDIAKKAYKKLDDYANLQGLFDSKRSAWLIWSENGTIVIAYSDLLAKKDAIDYIAKNYTTAAFGPGNGTLSKAMFDIEEYLTVLRETEQAPYMQELGKILGADALEAFKKLYSIYDEDLYVWLANLWCPDNGGFYYSASARNNEGFLPDLESTGQALKIMDNAGLSVALGGSWQKMLPADIAEKLVKFAYDMQAEDGYFYHPQWGTGISTSRRGRDAGWAKTILSGLGATPKYPYLSGITTPTASLHLTASLKGGSSAGLVSKVVATAASNSKYESEASFIAYLDSLKFNENSYSAGNVINSTTSEIKKAGYWETLRKYLTDHQNPENGLWEDEVTYQSVNGLMKLCTCFGSSYPNAEKALESAMQILMRPIDDELTGITYVYNPWVAIANLLHAVSDETKTTLRQMLRDNAKEIFLMTAEKLSAFAKDDGGFSYLRDYSSPFSQDSLVAVSGSVESDVNATTIAISTVVKYMEEVLDLKFPPLYSRYEGIYFVDTLTSMGTIIKDSLLAKDPEVITFDEYEDDDIKVDANVVTNPHPAVENRIGDAETDGSEYIWFEAALVPNPKKEAGNTDYVLYAGDKTRPADSGHDKLIAEAASSTVFSVTNLGAPGNCYVFEADMLFGGSESSTSPVAQLNFVRDTGKSPLISAWVDFYQYTRGGQNYLRIQEYFAGADGVKDTEVVAGIPVDEWFKLRIEMYKDYSGEGGELKIKLKFFVNGKFVGVSDSGHYEKGAYKDFLVNAVKISYYRHTASSFYLDNIYVAKKNLTFELGKYESDAVERPVSDKKVYDFNDGSIPNGPDNWTEMYYRNEDGEQVMINAADWNDELDSQFGGSKGPGAKVYIADDPESATNKVLRAYSFNTKSSSYKATMHVDGVLTKEGGGTWEVEFDYYFDKLSWIYSKNFFTLAFCNENGSTMTAINFNGLNWEDSHNSEVLQIALSDGRVLENFVLFDATWYTFKVVYHHNETNPAESMLLIYVLGTDGYQCIANTAVSSKFGEVRGVDLVFQCYDIRGTQYIDDLSVSITDTPYVYDKPIEGEIDIPVPEDNKIYVEDSQRGGGVYYESAERYTAASHAELIKNGIMAENTKRGDGIDDGNRELEFVNVDGGYALSYTSIASGNHALNFVSKAPAIDGFVFETDIKLSGVDTEEGRYIRFTGTATNGTADSGLYAFNLKFHKNPNDRTGGYIVTVQNNDQKVVIKDDVWVNVRLVAEGTKEGSPLNLYINGNLVIESTLNADISTIKGVELYTPSTYSGHGWEQGTVYLDNTYVSGTGVYVPPPTFTEESRGEGKNAGSAITYEGTTYDDLVDGGYMAKNTSRGDGIEAGKRTLEFKDVDGGNALVYSALGSGNHSINFKNENAPHYGFLFETDIKLNGINNSDSRKVAFVGTNSNGANNAGLWGVNIGFYKNTETEDGGYIVTVGGSDWKGIIAEDTWVNIRFESTSLAQDGAFSFYINGEKVCDGALTSAITSIKGIELYTPSTSEGDEGFVSGSISLDNTYVTGTEKPVQPDTPTPDAPTPDTPGQNTGSSGGNMDGEGWEDKK